MQPAACQTPGNASEHRQRVDVDGNIGAQMQSFGTQELLRGGKIPCLDEYDEAVDAAEASNHGRRRSKDLLVVLPGKRLCKVFDEYLRLRPGLSLILRLVEQLDEPAESG